MKKLTALLLGTVVSIAFTAPAFADNPVMKYLKSDDGNTGLFVGVSGTEGNIDSVDADYLRSQNTPSTWKLQDGKGARIQVGYDFGKLRIDWRLGGLRSNVEDIDGAVLETGTSRHAALAYSTGNIGLDLYRFGLINKHFVDIALTPYIEGGFGHGGGWMTGKKNSDGAGADTKRDAAGHGSAWSYGGGVLINLTSAVGITLGYHHLNIRMDNELVTSELGEVGVRFTF